ncbi:phosphoribulokinase [Synechococcus sp. FACHB-909]|uniref:phosphoribulokinase n=1 Tax=Synechococcus sp. FACHB-909 TaxID=2692863 RepID=UPI001689D3C2|nr:phosphoribulokinase [Synechococcus sp. FACHB-909]MBD2717745.1 phosphoribulokinase [Synechococcus sp. FACHB-909]
MPSEPAPDAWDGRLAGAGDLGPVHPSLLRLLALPMLRRLERGLRDGAATRRPVLALNGPVGAGKTSLGRALERLATLGGLRLTVASIDDLYLPAAERRARLAGNPFGVGRVPPGSHDLPLLLEALATWRAGGTLRLPRFDKTLAGGDGDRNGWREEPAEALVIEGWLMGCRALGAQALGERMGCGAGLEELNESERRWLPRWDDHLAAYDQLWKACDGLWLLRPERWSLPRRWRFQAEARQRRAGGGWLNGRQLDAMVRATLHSLPPALYQDPLLGPAGSGIPLQGGVVLDGRRHGHPLGIQLSSPASASSAIG